MTSTYVTRTPAPEPSVPKRAAGRTGAARSAPPGRRDARRPAARASGRSTTRPPVHHWFAEQLLLVLSGRRPVHSMLGHTRGPAFEQVTALAARSPLRPRGADSRTARLANVHGLRICADVIEAYARVTMGDRDRALAFRLEAAEDRRWRCSAVEFA